MMGSRFNAPANATPVNYLPLDTPLYVVYGNPNFPHLMCCKLRESEPGRPMLFSWVTWHARRGFNGVGELLSRWLPSQRMAYFFTNPDDALVFIRDLITPEVKK